MLFMNKAQISEVVLNTEQQNSLINLLPSIKTHEEEDMIGLMHVVGFILQKTVFDSISNKQIIENFKHGKTHALLVRNFPIEKQLPLTPTTGFCPLASIALSAQISFGMMGALNINPVTYRGENDDKVVRHVVPRIDGDNEISSHGSKLAFDFHVDNPDLPLVSEESCALSPCPEYLSLHSIRYDHNVPTKLLFLDDVIKECAKETIEVLSEPIFIIKEACFIYRY